jgi:hypothetical protein
MSYFYSLLLPSKCNYKLFPASELPMNCLLYSLSMVVTPDSINSSSDSRTNFFGTKYFQPKPVSLNSHLQALTFYDHNITLDPMLYTSKSNNVLLDKNKQSPGSVTSGCLIQYKHLSSEVIWFANSKKILYYESTKMSLNDEVYLWIRSTSGKSTGEHVADIQLSHRKCWHNGNTLRHIFRQYSIRILEVLLSILKFLVIFLSFTRKMPW